MDDFPGYHDPAGGDGGEDDAAADGDVFGEEVDLNFVLREMKVSQMFLGCRPLSLSREYV